MTNNELFAGMSDAEANALMLGANSILNTRDLESKMRKGENTELEFKLQVLTNQKAIMLLLLQSQHPKFAAGVVKKMELEY